jgi:hypothetical protein
MRANYQNPSRPHHMVLGLQHYLYCYPEDGGIMLFKSLVPVCQTTWCNSKTHNMNLHCKDHKSNIKWIHLSWGFGARQMDFYVTLHNSWHFWNLYAWAVMCTVLWIRTATLIKYHNPSISFLTTRHVILFTMLALLQYKEYSHNTAFINQSKLSMVHERAEITS